MFYFSSQLCAFVRRLLEMTERRSKACPARIICTLSLVINQSLPYHLFCTEPMQIGLFCPSPGNCDCGRNTVFHSSDPWKSTFYLLDPGRPFHVQYLLDSRFLERCRLIASRVVEGRSWSPSNNNESVVAGPIYLTTHRFNSKSCIQRKHKIQKLRP